MNNYLFSVIAFFTLGAAVFSLPVPAAAKTVDGIAVVVDHDSMTQGELEESIQGFFLSQRLNPAKPGSPEYESAKKDVVEGFIREVLLAEEADRDKIEVSDGEVDHEVDGEIQNMKKGFPTEEEFTDELKKEGITMDDLKQDTRDKLLRRIKANRALRSKQNELPVSPVVSDEAVSQYFVAHPQDYEQVKFDIILFRVPPKSKPEYVKELTAQAQGVLKQLKGGADFASMAKKYSEDQGSAEKGGAVGTVYRSELEPQLAKGIFTIPEKGMGIVKATDGIYIVKLDYKGKADYASVAPDIKEHLRKEKQDSALKDWFAGLKKNAYILVDGKAYIPPKEETVKEETPAATPAAATASGAKGEESKTETTAAAVGTAAEIKDTSSQPYPSLPPGDSLSLYVNGDAFFYGVQDLANYYPAGTSVAQNFPFGYGLNLGLDWSLDPTFQVGLMGESVGKWMETIGSDHWFQMAAGPALSLKLMIPLDESTNFTLNAAGGYYFLVWSTATISGNAANLNGSDWGGRAGGSLDFMLGDSKNTALALGAGYRYLKINPENLNNTVTTPAQLDFSGPYVEVGLKFFMGKD